MTPDPMLKFVARDRQTPDKRPADIRREDFQEIYARFSEERAGLQAARCSQCGVPFCQDHCPLGNNIPDWLRLVAEGRLDEAYAVSSSTNNMPEICGRICPQDRLCEGSCVIEQSGHGTVTIGAVEAYITDTAWENGWITPIKPQRERAQSVGIVGAGPAGLAAAEELRRSGFQVTVYDRYDRAGGLLIYGIPNFKLDKKIVERRVDRLKSSGVTFRLNFELGRDETLADLRKRHDAVLIAVGVYKGRELNCPGADDDIAVPALDYLTASNRKGLGDAVSAFDSGTLNAAGKRVVVIGGGDTAMDCVRTAVRQGAASVACLYRRDRENMPGSDREVANAIEEGVNFKWLSAPKAITAKGVVVSKMRLGSPDISGRRSPEVIEGEDSYLDADLVIKALGFGPQDADHLFGEPALTVTARGALKVNPVTLETSAPSVYAAGDIVRGASLVVWAIRDGRIAAASIATRLEKAAAEAPQSLAAAE